MVDICDIGIDEIVFNCWHSWMFFSLCQTLCKYVAQFSIANFDSSLDIDLGREAIIAMVTCAVHEKSIVQLTKGTISIFVCSCYRWRQFNIFIFQHLFSKTCGTIIFVLFVFTLLQLQWLLCCYNRMLVLCCWPWVCWSIYKLHWTLWEMLQLNQGMFEYSLLLAIEYSIVNISVPLLNNTDKMYSFHLN